MATKKLSAYTSALLGLPNSNGWRVLPIVDLRDPKALDSYMPDEATQRQARLESKPKKRPK